MRLNGKQTIFLLFLISLLNLLTHGSKLPPYNDARPSQYTWMFWLVVGILVVGSTSLLLQNTLGKAATLPLNCATEAHFGANIAG